MLIVTNPAGLRTETRPWRQNDLRIAFVPTMGNLHAGHIRLVERARAMADRVVVSIFVNPTQFGPNDDFAAYPRTPAEDVAALTEAGTDLLFMPPVSAMYPSPEDMTAYVEVPVLSDELCGQFRPGHFRGVTTVVCKLLNMVQPDVALFGEKDYQQLTLIRRMVSDLNLPVVIHGVATVREPSGLALSSRNGYLTAAEKTQAALLYRLLQEAGHAITSGNRDFSAIEAEKMSALSSAGFQPDYFAIRRASDLAIPDRQDQHFVVLTAARLGKARLIDNLGIDLTTPLTP